MQHKSLTNPFMTELHKLSVRIQDKSTFLGFTKAYPTTSGAFLEGAGYVGVHVLGKRFTEHLVTGEREASYIDRGLFHIVVITTLTGTLYKRFESRDEAIKWFHAIDVLDLTTDTLLRWPTY